MEKWSNFCTVTWWIAVPAKTVYSQFHREIFAHFHQILGDHHDQSVSSSPLSACTWLLSLCLFPAWCRHRWVHSLLVHAKQLLRIILPKVMTHGICGKGAQMMMNLRVTCDWVNREQILRVAVAFPAVLTSFLRLCRELSCHIFQLISPTIQVKLVFQKFLALKNNNKKITWTIASICSGFDAFEFGIFKDGNSSATAKHCANSCGDWWRKFNNSMYCDKCWYFNDEL